MKTKKVNEILPTKIVGTTVRKDVEDELKSKKLILEEHKARLNGGISPTFKRDVSPIDVEIDGRTRELTMKRIEAEQFVFISPEFKFQTNPEWLEQQRWFLNKRVEELAKVLETVKKQKETIIKEIPELENRIKQLTEQLSNFKLENTEKEKVETITG